MSRTSIVHLQERSYAVCCNMVRPVVMRVKEELHSSSSFTLITTGRIETYQIATHSIRTLLKMDCWSSRHVELLNVTNKINHQILCTLLDYGYIGEYFISTRNRPKYSLVENSVHHCSVTLRKADRLRVFEYGVLRQIGGPKKHGSGEDYIARNFMICTIHQILCRWSN